MSRLLVVGIGTPSLIAAKRHAGPGLRSTHLARALARAGHDVLLVTVRLASDDDAPPALFDFTIDDEKGAAPIRLLGTTERELLQPALRRRLEDFRADAVVGVTVYASSLVARLRLGLPFWADVFGDLMAEAQAKAAASGSDWAIVHFWTLLAGVLASADRFSAVSLRQAHALVGQLGLAGRLTMRTAGEPLVATIPCAAEPSPHAPARAAARESFGLLPGDFVVLLSGGVNTWCDLETIVAGLGHAMREEASIRVVVTGGSIPGHDETSHCVLARGLTAIDLDESRDEAATRGEQRAPIAPRPPVERRPRVQMLGWVEPSRLAAIYAAADLALHIERPLFERELGAENRVVEWLASGVPVLSTALSETGGELAARGVVSRIGTGDPAQLAREICRLSRSSALLAEQAEAGRRWAAGERNYSMTAAPLLDWAAAPVAARDRDGARLVTIGLLSHPETSVELLEAYVAALPVRELARRGVRWIWRRSMGGAVRLLARARDTLLQRRAARRPGRTTWSLLVAAALVTGAALLLSGCARGHLAAGGSRPNILLISVDTLRADHLGTYAYKVRPSPSPWIDRLAAGGVVFDAAITSAPETAPAVATLMTGLYQDRHGVMYNREKLGEDNVTLAERLRGSGYDTHAFVANWLLDGEHGYAQGFDSFEVLPAGVTSYQSSDDKVVAAVGGFLRDRGDTAKGPWFVWAHMMDPHGPYNSAAPWWSASFDYSAVPASPDREPPISDSNFGLGVIPAYQKLEGVTRLSDYVRRYDGEIRDTDTQIGSILSILAATGAAAGTVVIVTADHGESLVEHDELLQHGWFVYDPTVRIPLVVSWPGRIPAGRRVAGEVCSVDLVPTILDLAGATAATDLDGRSFAGDLGIAGAAAATPDLRAAGCFVIGPRANHPLALRTKEFKAIVTPEGAPTDPRAEKGERTNEPERIELYDLARDPAEVDDVASRRRDVAGEMVAHIAELRARFRASGWRW